MWASYKMRKYQTSWTSRKWIQQGSMLQIKKQKTANLQQIIHQRSKEPWKWRRMPWKRKQSTNGDRSDVASVTKWKRTIKELNIHHRDNHNPQLCGICNRSFKLASSLTRHMYDHKKPKLECDQCDYRCQFESELQTHKITHREEPIISMHESQLREMVQMEVGSDITPTRTQWCVTWMWLRGLQIFKRDQKTIKGAPEKS